MDTSNRTNWIIIGTVAVVLILGGWWLFMGKADDSQGAVATTTGTGTPTTGTTVTPTVPVTTTTASGETVSVQNQAAGASVAISGMNLTRESWVAVRDAKSILGAGRFAAGATSGTVKLLRSTVKGETYQVVVYVDDGDKKFDFKVDALVSGVNASFMAQ